MTAEQPDHERILVLAPTRGDADLCRRFLAEADLRSEVCEGDDALCAALQRPAAVLVIAEESLHGRAGACIRDRLAEQPEWSALPVIVLANGHSRASISLLDGYDSYGRVTLLERPVRMFTFIGTVRLALRERHQQYRVRDLLAERAERINQRDEFLAMLGHELRNPLAAILTCNDVLDAVRPDSEHAQRCRSVIATQARQIKRLLDDLSDVSRIARRKLSLQRKRTALSEVLQDVVAQVRGIIHESRQVLEIDLPDEPLSLLADGMRLRQVFANLLTNANRYTPEGGHIRLAATASNGLVRVSIRDDGAGMSEETLAQIFDPFYQAKMGGTSRGSRAGLGIGLTLSRSLVEMHAGTIQAHSAGPGQGSELIVTLPLHTAADEAPADDGADGAQGAAGGQAAPRHILLIEDNQDFAIGLKRLLEARGHSVALAHDGVDGLRVAQDRHPDVVVLDIGLPGIDGYEVARRLRRLHGLAKVPIVAVSGFGGGTDRQRSEAAGIDRHLVKPIGLPELEAAIFG